MDIIEQKSQEELKCSKIQKERKRREREEKRNEEREQKKKKKRTEKKKRRKKKQKREHKKKTEKSWLPSVLEIDAVPVLSQLRQKAISH